MGLRGFHRCWRVVRYGTYVCGMLVDGWVTYCPAAASLKGCRVELSSLKGGSILKGRIVLSGKREGW